MATRPTTKQMLVSVWRRLDAAFARCAVPLAALCAGDATSAALAGSAALASALPLRWMWIPVVGVWAYATPLYSMRALATITAALVTIGLVERQRHWHELGVGSDEGVILVQGVMLGLWRGALTVTEALSELQLVREASAPRASPQDICAAVALLVGGTCLTWLLVLPILWTHSRQRSSSGPAESSSASSLGWAENAWVWCCLVGVIAGVEYPMLWMRLGSEPFTWALSVLCGTPALMGLVAWWCAVVAVLVAFTPPRERPHLRHSETDEDPTTHRGTAPVLLHLARTSESEEQPEDRGRAVPAPRTHGSARRSLPCDSLRRAASRLSPHQALLIVRKFFHAAAVAMFAPALFVQGGTGSLALAFACAAKVLCTLELLRALRAHPLWLSRSVHVFMHGFTDGRDSGALVLTHLYLLLGCAAPLWLWLGTRLEGGGGDVLLIQAEGSVSSERGSSGLQALPPAAALGAAPLAGIAVLGAGDAAAAAVGILATALGYAHTWGWALGVACRPPPRQQHLSRAAVAPAAWAGARKTLEGSAAFVIAVLVCLGVVDAVLISFIGPPLQQQQQQQQQQPWGAAVARWGRVACCATLASLLETFTHAIDNATLPAAFYVCIEWSGYSRVS